jgi:hypothetical protein
MSRAYAVTGMLVALLLAGGAIGSRTAVPLLAPTGYKNFCDGFRDLTPAQRKQVQPCPSGGVPAKFWRPLNLPSLLPDGSCPLTTAHRVFKSMYPLLGDGPVYFLAGLSANFNILRVQEPAAMFPQTGWVGAKLIIPLRHGFKGPILARGGGIGSAGELGFSGIGHREFAAMQFPPGWTTGRTMAKDAVFTGGAIWVSEPGCYGLQLDTASSSDVVVFEAQLYT